MQNMIILNQMEECHATEYFSHWIEGHYVWMYLTCEVSAKRTTQDNIYRQGKNGKHSH
jgi:hypothetical protein